MNARAPDELVDAVVVPIRDVVERAQQATQRARDEVLHVSAATADAARPILKRAPMESQDRSPAIAVGLTMLLEGLGQVYNGQPRKGVAFFAVGKALSGGSGLMTWLLRRVLRFERAKLGPSRVRPGLAVLWAGSFAWCMWDAWKNASPRQKGS